MNQPVNSVDGLKWNVHATVERYSPEQTAEAIAFYGHDPDAVELRALFPAGPGDGTIEVPGNLLVTAGLTVITTLITGGVANAFNHTNAIVGVGATATAATIADTALGADNTANAWYQQCDVSNPTNALGVITTTCTFASGNANFAWQEWCWAFGGGGTITSGIRLSLLTSTAPTMMNHKIQSLGTKAAAAWAFTATGTFS